MSALWQYCQMRQQDLLDLGLARRLAREGAARQIRMTAGLRQIDVALAVGTYTQTLNHVEAGRRPVPRTWGPAYGRLLRELLDGQP